MMTIVFETVRFAFRVSPDEVDVCVDCGGAGEIIVPALPPRGKYVGAIDGSERITCQGCDGYRIRDDDGEGVPVEVFEVVEIAS